MVKTLLMTVMCGGKIWSCHMGIGTWNKALPISQQREIDITTLSVIYSITKTKMIVT